MHEALIVGSWWKRLWSRGLQILEKKETESLHAEIDFFDAIAEAYEIFLFEIDVRAAVKGLLMEL